MKQNKNFLLLSILLIINSSDINARNYDWYQLPNSPHTTGRFESLFFINENTGWLIHLYGVIHRTNDAGSNWIRQDSIYLGSFRTITFINESTGWIGSLNSNYVLFKTTNGGFSWNAETNIPAPVPRGICGIHALNENFIYGCGRYDGFSNFIKSTDGGDSWITKDMSQYATGLVDCYFFNSDTGIAVGGEGFLNSGKSKILHTTDGGETWSVKYLGTRSSEICWKISFPDKLNGFVSLERGNSSQRFFLKTSDGGLNWTELDFPDNINEQGIGFINANTGWIGGNFQPVYGTTNAGMSWFNSNIGININRFQMFGDTLGYACGQYVFKFSKISGVYSVISQVPEDFNLFQNYPNPFNSQTKIRFSIKQSGRYGLEVYDITGQKIQSILNERFQPGIYETTLNSKEMSSGIYYYTLTNGILSVTKKFALIK